MESCPSKVGETRIHGRVLRRVCDRTKWPRRWWWPVDAEIDIPLEEWRRQHDEASKTINRLLVALVGFCFFCLLALGTPDKSLLARDATIKLPFANTTISFLAFLWIGPALLIGLVRYLQIFLGYWVRLSYAPVKGSLAYKQEPVSRGLPFIFNLPGRLGSWISSFLFYWLVPLVLLVFTEKTLPRVQGPTMFAVTCVVTDALILVQLRRRRSDTPVIVALLLWTSLIVVGILFGETVYFLQEPSFVMQKVSPNMSVGRRRRPWFLERSLIFEFVLTRAGVRLAPLQNCVINSSRSTAVFNRRKPSRSCGVMR